MIVVGPSFTRLTLMSAPKRPVATCAPRARSSSATTSTSGSATGPGAAACHDNAYGMSGEEPGQSVDVGMDVETDVMVLAIESAGQQLPPVFFLGEDSVEKQKQIEQLRFPHGNRKGSVSTCFHRYLHHR